MSKENKTSDNQQNGNDFITDVTHRFSKEDLWDAWWASAIKTISFSGVDKDYEPRCFEKFYEYKLSSLNGQTKRDVTDTAVGAVAQHLLQLEEKMRFNYKGELYELKVEKVVDK